MKERVATGVRWLVKWALSWGKAVESDAPVLLPLTPKYDPKKHGVYFDVIESALADGSNDVRNIALTGSYGVGKSSILSEVTRRHKRDVIAVSLSTLGFPEDEPQPAGDTAKAASTKTNRIQKEIVKQLLYSQDPLKTPGSRYRRTTRFRFWRSLGLSALLSVVIAVVFFLTGWTALIATLIPGSAEAPWSGHAVVFAVATILLVCLLAVFHNRFQIEKLGAGAATISLSTKSSTFFDEYLDEIVYFFEVVKRDIVIFEDIDRFDDAHIFETLRSLNSILSGAKQLRGRKIRFIYAIKDSIFDELGARAAKDEATDETEPATEEERRRRDAAEAEVARANRTKFFDLVVPVVPFITHRSARDLLVQTMGEELDHAVSHELIDLTARHVADMRLIKNIRNEYAIFKRQVIDTGSLDLGEDGLFAMVLYKSTHLADFELIKLCKSNIDELYRSGRQIVSDNIKALNAKIRSARRSRQSISVSSERAKELGDLFANHITLTFRHLALPNVQVQSRTMAGEEIDDAALRSPDFWEKFAATDGTVDVSYYRREYGRYESLSFKRKDVAQAMRRPIDSVEWAAETRARIDAEISAAVRDRDFLAHADMSELFQRNEFKAAFKGVERSFEEMAEKYLKSELALRLLEGGFIDRNFTLYTSTFYGDRVSANAMNFILKNVDPNTIDVHFSLETEDVAAIIRERGRSFLNEKSAYNVGVLDYLAHNDQPGLGVLADRLVSFGEEEQEILLAYMDKGTGVAELVAELAPRWTAMFTFLVTEAGLDEESRTTLVDSALSVADAELQYEADGATGAFILEDYRRLRTFTSDGASESAASVAASLVLTSGVRLPSLVELGNSAREAIVSNRSYEVDRDNLLAALQDSEHDLSLDSIRSSSRDVYLRVLADLEDYLAALGADGYTVRSPSDFGAVLEEVLDQDESALSEIVARSAPGCVVANLDDVPSEIWTVLADHGRFPVTFNNVRAYVTEFGLDDRLARMLTAAESISVADDADEEAKIEVGLAILGASNVIPSPGKRAELVGGMHIKAYLDASAVPSEPGELIGWLIHEEVIADDAESFAVIQASDTDGLAFAINKSAEFPNFMTVNEVTPSNVALLVQHELVPVAVKEAIVRRFTEFTAGTSRTGLELIARYAVRAGISLTLAEVTRLASEKVGAPLVTSLLQPHLANADMSTLAPLLDSLGGEYRKLASANGKHPRIPNSPANEALILRLEQLGVASSHAVIGPDIRVNMKQS